MRRIGVIYGSDREGRFCDVVAGWVLGQLASEPDLELDPIDDEPQAARALRHMVSRLKWWFDALRQARHARPYAAAAA